MLAAPVKLPSLVIQAASAAVSTLFGAFLFLYATFRELSAPGWTPRAGSSARSASFSTRSFLSYTLCALVEALPTPFLARYAPKLDSCPQNPPRPAFPGTRPRVVFQREGEAQRKVPFQVLASIMSPSGWHQRSEM